MPDKPRLLLVDDDTVTLQVLSKSLAPFARMRFARSGAEALKAVESELPDLVILDLNMPGLDGLEVLSALRSRPQSAQLPVILVTGASDETLEASALELGAQDFIRKPFQPEQLVARMRALLRLAALRASGAAPGIQPFHVGARILLVDDDETAIEAMRTTLAPTGAVLLTAANGDEALNLMHAQAPDLVLLDAEMPRLDGYAVCQAMQSDPVLAQVPVAFVSMHAEARFEARSFAVGAADFVAKPFKPEVLLARVRKLLQMRRERDASLEAVAAQWQEMGDRRVAELVAVASDAIVSIDAGGKVRLMNKAATCLFGVPAERALGQPAETVLPGWLAMEFGSGDLGLAHDRRRNHRPGKALRLFRGDGAVHTVEPIVFQQGGGEHRLTTVVLRDATDRIAAEQRRQALRDAVVASAAQLSLLRALPGETQTTESLVALGQERARLPHGAPQLREFDLAQALEEVRQWAKEDRLAAQLTCSLPNRTLCVLGERLTFVAGLQNLLSATVGATPQRLAVEVLGKVDDVVSLELTLPLEFAAAQHKARPDWQFALTQLCAGGAVESQELGSSSVEGRLLRFRLLRAQHDR